MCARCCWHLIERKPGLLTKCAPFGHVVMRQDLLLLATMRARATTGRLGCRLQSVTVLLTVTWSDPLFFLFQSSIACARYSALRGVDLTLALPLPCKKNWCYSAKIHVKWTRDGSYTRALCLSHSLTHSLTHTLLLISPHCLFHSHYRTISCCHLF